MVKSMFAGVAGLKAHQSKMDIIGNNIANVNTWGYKAASLSFKDAMYQSTSTGTGGNAATGGYGGTNANQVGLGVNTGAITYDFSMGGMAPSSRALDCMIDGDGFFIVGPMVSGGSVQLGDDDAVENSGLYLSRVGIFEVDNNGYLTDADGNYVYGFVNNSGDFSQSDSFDTTSLQPLRIPTSADMASIDNTQAKDLVAEKKKAYEDALNMLTVVNGALGTARQEFIAAQAAYDDALKTTNVEKTPYIPDPADPTDPDLGTPATYYSLDELRTLYTDAKADMEKAYAAWVADPDGNVEGSAPVVSLKEAYADAKKKCDEANYKLILGQASIRAPQALIDNDKLINGDPAAVAPASPDSLWKQYEDAYTAYWTLPANADPVLDVEPAKKALEEARAALEGLEKSLSKIEDDSIEGKYNAAKLKVDAAKAKVDAAQKTVDDAKKNWETAQKSEITTQQENADSDDQRADLQNYQILEDGTLVAVSKKSNATVILGKVALASVQNPSGLVKDSGYYYSASANSGKISTYEAGGTVGKIKGNFKEMSKVDLSTELTEMITTQRGFQANSKIITVTDSMLEELVNMKR